MFFCCELCRTQFVELCDRIRSSTGWSSIGGLEIVGDRQGRTVTARRGDDQARFFVAFNSEGHVRRFGPVPR